VQVTPKMVTMGAATAATGAAVAGAE
jgi:hypothetical protein